MTTRLFQVYPGKCTACRNCEVACAFSHACRGVPGASRIRALPDPQRREGRDLVVVCLQCEHAACVAACPANALARATESGAIEHQPERCIRCAACVAACPFGNIRWDRAADLPAKCDVCRGEPACVRFCPTGALEYK
jgi:Fe-S-cluster-containing hydrogenase component 2